MKNSEVGVYILTHNRPNTLIRSLNSVRNQLFKDFSIVISDNSTNSDTEKLINSIIIGDSQICYERRNEGCDTGIRHINYILAHSRFDYFMIFHDDDEMMPHMVGELYNYLKGNSNLSAVAANAYFNKNGKNTQTLFFSEKRNIILSTKETISLKYVNGGIAPFPSIMYVKKKIEGLKLDIHYGGKYSDSSFVISLTTRGGLGMIAKPCMYYYISSSQDSQHHEFIQYLSLIKFIEKILGKPDVVSMRIFNLYSQATTIMHKTGKPYFRRVLFFAFFKYSFKNYFLKYLIQILGYRR